MRNKKALNIVLLFTMLLSTACMQSCNDEPATTRPEPEPLWHGWNKYQIKPEDTLAILGHDIIENTAYYFGPKGKLAQLNMGMNCQNCHIEGGTIPWGNNFSGVISCYPFFMERSHSLETIAERVNDCFTRSLNGKPIDTTSKAMQAIIAYLHWVGDDIPKGKRPRGVGIMQLPYLDRAADAAKGKLVYINTCQRCHGADGQGAPNAGGYGYTYPPLWGPNSFNMGASFYRIGKLAGFIFTNMPYQEATYDSPKLSNEEAWDVAAYICSQPRPVIDVSKDWPNKAKKPYDVPFGPYADNFSELQHKYGPFKAMVH